jgi:hypothetical protein
MGHDHPDALNPADRRATVAVLTDSSGALAGQYQINCRHPARDLRQRQRQGARLTGKEGR